MKRDTIPTRMRAPNAERESIEFLSKAGVECVRHGAPEYHLYRRHDNHLFVPRYLHNGSTEMTLHIQGYPGLQRAGNIVVSARVLDSRLLAQYRTEKETIGNEHEAVLSTVPGFEDATAIRMDPEQFVGRLYDATTRRSLLQEILHTV